MIDMENNIRQIRYRNFRLSTDGEYSIASSTSTITVSAENEWGLRDDLSRVVGFPFITADHNQNDCLTIKGYQTAGW